MNSTRTMQRGFVLLGLLLGCCGCATAERHTQEAVSIAPPPEDPFAAAVEHLREISSRMTSLEADIDKLVDQMEQLRDARSMRIVASEVADAVLGQLTGFTQDIAIEEVERSLLKTLSPQAAAIAQRFGIINRLASIGVSIAIIHDRVAIASLKLSQAASLKEDISFIREVVIPARLELAVRTQEIAEKADALRLRRAEIARRSADVRGRWLSVLATANSLTQQAEEVQE